jgi:N-acetylgalactosamine kinase
VFVISNSLVVSNKKETAEKNYNMRVIECRLGSALIGFKLKCSGWEKPKTLSLLQRDLKKSLKEMIEICEENLSKENYSLEEISKELNSTKEEIIENYFKSTSGAIIKVDSLNEFKLLNRCVHVFSESLRVEEFMEASKEKNIEKIGTLMNSSHFSLRDNFEASCEGLEKLTTICRNSGALGSRLTGAGWV